ncbi:sensor histidine kinase [Microbacterium sp. NPDC057650]|uniref:sensor histidine kinase n=1 Tax=unclassified Microbacterium TaxID=2609290 RepID=UPI00366D4B6C
MALPNTSAPPRLRRTRASAGTITLYIVGMLFDTFAMINVPGAVSLPATPQGETALSNFGTLLFLTVIAAWVTVFWRRRLPILALLAGAALALIGVSYVLLLIGAVGCVRRRPAWTPWVAIGATTVVILFAIRESLTGWGAALPWMFTSRADAQYEPVWIAASFIWAVISLGVAVAVVIVGRARDRARRSDVRADEEHRRADALNEQMVRQSERASIARDMHDSLTNKLAVISLHAEALEQTTTEGDAGEMARTLQQQARAALHDLRGLIGDLRTEPGRSSTAPATMRALGALVGEFRAAGAPINAYILIESPERASTQLQGATYRIVQESLTNAVKHAPRAPVDLHVQVDPAEGARIRIVNPLTPGASSGIPGGGNGILGVRERAEALGGSAWVGPYEGQFIVDVTLPWQEMS